MFSNKFILFVVIFSLTQTLVNGESVLPKSQILIAPRIRLETYSKHESVEIILNEKKVRDGKLNEILMPRNKIKIYLASISSNWGGSNYDPEGTFNKNENTFEIRIFIDRTVNGYNTPYHITEMDSTKSNDFQIIFKLDWKPPQKGFIKYPVIMEKEFALPTLPEFKWQKMIYKNIANQLSYAAQDFQIIINGKEYLKPLSEYDEYRLFPTNVTNWAIMPFLKKGNNDILIRFPKAPEKKMLENNTAEFYFQIYPVIDNPDEHLKGHTWTWTARRSLFEIDLKSNDLKKLKFPYELKKSFNID